MQLSLGEVLSLAACNRLVLGLEERAHACKTARLASPPPIVLVDGLWLKLAVPTGEITTYRRGRKRTVKRKQPRVMLTALGLWPDGHWEILAWHLATAEDAPAWGTFVGTLYTKGVTEQTTQLIVSDGSQGLEKALYSHLYGVPHQRCLFHKIKNITDYLHYEEGVGAAGETLVPPSRQAKKERKRAILADASQIYATDVEGEIRARAQVFRDTWEAREPQAVAAFFHNFEQTLCYLTVHFPRAYVSLIRTTNLLERFHKEIRRKQRDIGMLQSAAGGDVLWYMVAMRETAKQRALCRDKDCEFAKKVIHYPVLCTSAAQSETAGDKIFLASYGPGSPQLLHRGADASEADRPSREAGVMGFPTDLTSETGIAVQRVETP